MDVIDLKKRKFDYFYFQSKLSNKRFKDLYKTKCNEVFKKKGIELGIYKLHPKNNKYGVLDNDGTWSFLNTINTHPYCFYELFYLFKDNKGEDLNLDDPNTWEFNINRLFEFIEYNFELFFTRNKGSNYYNIFLFRCNRSWFNGVASVIGFIYSSKDLFKHKEIDRLTYSFERGDPEDLGGVDAKVFYKDRTYNTIQIKSGTVVSYDGDYYILKSSQNDLSSRADLYCFVDLVGIPTCYLFWNSPLEIKRDENGKYYFPNSLFLSKIKKDMSVPIKIQDFVEFCYQKKIIFNLTCDENSINSVIIDTIDPTPILTINITDFDDSNLPTLLETEFERLKNRFN